MEQSSTSKDGKSENVNDASPKDKLFDPSIDMLVNDFDDERTLEEEEAIAAGEANDPSQELSSLEKESNMPLEELLSLYGYNNLQDHTTSESDDEEEMQRQADELICEPIVEKERSPTPPRRSKLSILYEPMLDDTDESRNMCSVSRLSEDEEEYASDGDDDYKKNRKTIMVGGDYQANIPDVLCQYDKTLLNENDDQLLWTPQESYNQKVEEYLRKAHEISKALIPNETLLRDNEEALYVLQQCDYDTDKALKQLEEKPQPPPNLVANNINKMIWSEEESRNVISGVCISDINKRIRSEEESRNVISGVCISGEDLYIIE